MVKGQAGTGKTTMALQVLEELSGPDRSFYVSTRVSDESLYNLFPWLREKEMRGRVVDASREFLRALYERAENENKEVKAADKKTAGAKAFLRSINREKSPTRVDRTHLTTLMQDYDLLEVKRLYDRIEEKLPNQCLVVVDSIEGITTKYKIPPEDLVCALQKDLVENTSTHLVLVMEFADDTSVDYLVDGVINLTRSSTEGRRIREVHLEKLRATEIMQPIYLTTLRGGRFKVFEPFAPAVTTGAWKVTPNPAAHYSTGTPDIDALLGGGFSVGSYNVIEVGNDVSNDQYLSVVRPLLLNFLSHGLGATAVLTGGDHVEALREDLTRFLPPTTFDRLFYVTDYSLSHSDKPNVLPLKDKKPEEALALWQRVMGAIRGKENKPLMDFVGFDTLEYRFGDIAIQDLFRTVSNIKVSKDLGIGILKPGLKLQQEILNMADTYLRVVNIHRACCIYGVKPQTSLHVVHPDPERGYPHVSLTPIL